MQWNLFDNGASIGHEGSECGVILRDDEHEFGARITLEQGGSISPFAITCDIYGWMFHTRFMGSLHQAEAECALIQTELSAILALISLTNDLQADENMAQVSAAIAAFVERYP